jgi:hypothetical protein
MYMYRSLEKKSLLHPLPIGTILQPASIHEIDCQAKEGHAMDKDGATDFFISYTHNDQRWAEWIAWYLEEAGYRTLLQAWRCICFSRSIL